MVTAIQKNTWSMLFRGIIGVSFGLCALFYPDVTLAILIALFGLYVFFSGICNVIFSLFDRHYDRSWWLYFTEGFLGLIAGFLVLIWPKVTSFFFIYVIATWAILTGIIQMITYIRLQQIFEHEFLLGISGILSILIGIILFRFPIGGIITIAWIIGVYALIFGILLIISSVRIHNSSKW